MSGSLALVSEPPLNRQHWATPPEFIDAIARRFGRPDFDLAASPENAKADLFFTEADDALKQDWVKPRGISPLVCYVNPPYAAIEDWVAKCEEVRLLPRWTLALVPASVDSNWFDRHVHNKAHWFGLKGRITFVGAKDPYMKPLMLAAYGFGVSGSSPWDWRKA